MNDQTRREWVFHIGQAAAGLGVASSLSAESSNPVALPPGVYLPSTGHLSHALMSADRYHPVPAGCPTDYVRPTNGPFEPSFFSKTEFRVIHRLTQLLLGEVSGEEGVSQEVAEWMDLSVSSAGGGHEAELRLAPLHRALAAAYFGSDKESNAEADSPRICREGLAWISRAAQTQHSGEFLSLSVDRQTELLDSIADGRADRQNENAGTKFFALLKAEVTRGFYTSQAGLKELNFKGNAFYAQSPGCQSK